MDRQVDKWTGRQTNAQTESLEVNTGVYSMAYKQIVI
jgi:hypothetical protein